MKKLARILVLLSLAGCNDAEVAYEKNTRHGLVLIEDATLGTPQKPAGNVDIFLTNQARDTSSFMIRIKSDADGGFLFTHFPAGDRSKYYIYSYYIKGGTIYRSAFKKLSDFINDSKDTLVIKPKYNPGIKVSLQDSVSGSAIPSATICLFNNSQLASSGTCDGSIRTGTSNEYGNAYFDNLSTGKYFATVNQKIGGISYAGSGAVNFTGGSTAAIIKLQQEGIVIYVKESTYNTPVAGIDVCLFTNRILGEGTVCTGSIHTITADNYGKAVFQNLLSGTHYFVVNQKISNVTFTGKEKVDFKVGGHVEKTMMVNPN